MEYRTNKRTGDRISVIGLGTSYIAETEEKEAVQALEYAYENGINYADLATADAKTFIYYGKAFSSVRKNLFYQVHFGANYESGAYGWTTNVETIRRSVDAQLTALQTDYIDYGFIHCLDEEKDWQTYQEGGALAYLLELKKQGVVRHIGLSSHTPSLVTKVLDAGIVDQLMFSINPGYDYRHGDYANGSTEDRMAMYRRCEADGVGISVMKPFSGGQLLEDKTSPFGRALTRYQCIQYSLDKPGVLTVLPGIRNVEDVKNLLGFLTASSRERDYSVVGTFMPGEAVGNCVYCNHCQPCPAGLNVGLINKYYNLDGFLEQGGASDDLAVAAPFAPMDGMNEKGLCVAVLMIQDSPGFRQDTGKPDLTTTMAVHEKAGTVKRRNKQKICDASEWR